MSTIARRDFAIYAITKHGIEIARRLADALPEADLFISKKLGGQMELPMGPTLTKTFTEYNCHIHIISVGAVVRMIAPLLKDKKTDPAIVCVDDGAQFSICVLSGHVGRGNSFTHRVAHILGATPVVTTASDVRGTLTVDILGRDLGWRLDDPDHNVTRGCAAVVNETPVLFVQETGEPHWWPLDKPLPTNVCYAPSLNGNAAQYEIILWTTDRIVDAPENAIIYRPRSLVLGVGCDSNTPGDLFERGVLKTLSDNGLAFACVKEIATIDKKRDEAAIVEFAAKHDLPIRIYPAVELDRVEGIENPSETVKKYVGTRTVAEGAALLAANADRLLVPKTTYTEEGAGRSMTCAVARIPFEKRK